MSAFILRLSGRLRSLALVALALVCAFRANAALAQSADQPPHKRAESTAQQPDNGVALENDRAFVLEFSNDQVRVYRIELAPQASTALDRRDRDYLVLAVTAARLQATDGKHTRDLNLEPEGLQLMKGGWAHRLVNQGDSPAVIIEVAPTAKLDPEHASCGLAERECKGGEVGDELGQYTESVLFETPSAKLIQAAISPGATIPPTEYVYPTLIMAANDASLRDLRNQKATADEAPPPAATDWLLKAGATAWLPGSSTDALKNSGPVEARILLLILRPPE